MTSKTYTEEDMIKFVDFVESKFIRKLPDGWHRMTDDPNDFPKNFATLSDKELLDWFNQSK